MKAIMILLAISLILNSNLFSQTKKVITADDPITPGSRKEIIKNSNRPDHKRNDNPREKTNEDKDRTNHHREEQRKTEVIHTQTNPVEKSRNTNVNNDNNRPDVNEHDHYIPIVETKNYFDGEIHHICISQKDRGKELLGNLNYSAALDLFLKYLTDNPKDIELYYLIGLTEVYLENYNDALEDLNFYISFFDDDGEAYYQRGITKLFLGMRKEAQDDLTISDQLGCKKAYSFIKKYF